MTSPARLITIPISHYCEKARWALERAGVPYVEEPHAPILHWRATLPFRTRTVPVLVATGAVLKSSSEIVRWADARTTAGAHLFPVDPTLRREVEELEEHFDRKLGPATRRWAYSFVLPDRRRAVELLSAGIGRSERAALEKTHAILFGLMKRGMNVTPEGAQKSLERLRALFGEVDVRLRDGRRFLVGDAFSAADLAFAALAVPVIHPPQYAWSQPIPSLPAEMRREVEALRQTRAGEHVLRMYREERPRAFPKAA